MVQFLFLLIFLNSFLNNNSYLLLQILSLIRFYLIFLPFCLLFPKVRPNLIGLNVLLVHRLLFFLYYLHCNVLCNIDLSTCLAYGQFCYPDLFYLYILHCYKSFAFLFYPLFAVMKKVPGRLLHSVFYRPLHPVQFLFVLMGFLFWLPLYICLILISAASSLMILVMHLLLLMLNLSTVFLHLPIHFQRTFLISC